jgi:hypothetical protein
VISDACSMDGPCALPRQLKLKAGVLEMLPTGTLGIDDLCDRVRAEYHEMPGLCLTQRQICRLWDLDPSACEVLLQRLLAEGFLRRTDGDEYVLVRAVCERPWPRTRFTTAAHDHEERRHNDQRERGVLSPR